MKLENPWIAAECRAHTVAANKLPTFLQEQYGQLGEDLILEGVLKSWFAHRSLPLQQVRYLEVGANHPIQTSNTYLFGRKWGGRGVLVEANPDLVEALMQVRGQDRVLNFAVVPPGFPQRVRINISAHSELSSLDAGHVKSFGALGQIDRVVEVESVTLDELLDHCFPEGLHLLSIDIEGLDLEVIRHSQFHRRPVFIVTEPSRHYHAGAEAAFRHVMAEKGYVEVARTDYNLIFGDARAMVFATPAEPAAPAAAWTPAATIDSFDVFDTLIARRCIDAKAVFAEVERRSGLAGFAAWREQSERAVEQGEYTLADIYGELARRASLPAEAAQGLLAMELQVELENVVPIADHLDELREGSLLISDMYLPDEAIRLLLGAAGVSPALPLLRSAHGKRSGRVWQELSRAGLRCSHLGDNPESDLARPAAAGMRPRLTKIAQPTPTERQIAMAGCPRLAESLRAARLMTRRGSLPAGLHRLQVELNLPLLTIAALVLHAHLAGQDGAHVMFAARDARYFHAVFDAVSAAAGPVGPKTSYWHTSRIARTRGDADYLAYCRQLIGEEALLVDLCGTGASLARLRQLLGMSDEQAPVFMCQRVDEPQLSGALAARYGLAQLAEPTALWSNRDLVGNEVLELLNYVPEGMTLGVARVAGGFVPLRDELEFDAQQLAQVREQARLAAEFAANLRGALVPAVFDEVRGETPRLIAALSAVVPGLRTEIEALLAAWLGAHREREAAVAPQLGRA
jgi:FkbM family methyltransferase